MTNAFKGAVLSFFSGHFYGEVARERRGIGMSFVLVLTLLMTGQFFVAFLLSGQYAQGREALARLPAVADGLPAIIVKDGKLSIDKPVPYTLTLGSEPDEARIVIDTNYKITDVNALEKYMRQNRIVMLATADKIVTRDVRQMGGQPAQIDNSLRITDLKDSGAFSFTHDNWRALGATVAGWGMSALLTIAFVAMLFGVFVANFLSTVFSGIAVMAVDLVAKTHLEFSAAMRLAAAFRIPVVILSLAPMLIGMNPVLGLYGWILWGLYLMFAIWSVRLYGGKGA